MLYYKNIEISEMYKVSPNTVGNWIDGAIEKKINLQLHQEGERYYILDNENNHSLLKELSHRGQKYKNSRSLKIIKPDKAFYEHFTENQIIQIVNDLDIYKDIDLKFGYFNEGAKSFDKYVRKSITEHSSTTPGNTSELLDFNSPYILSLIKDFQKINIVDIGPGNGMPLKNFIDYLLKKGVLQKYIALDYSKEMLNINEEFIQKTFASKVSYESYVKDINFDTFRDILFKNVSSKGINDSSVNLILFVGSTIENQREYSQPLHIIKSSMGPQDLLILNHRLDTEDARRTLSFPANSEHPDRDIDVMYMVLDLLGIETSYYDVERFYDKAQKMRIIRIKLKTDLIIKFETKNIKTEVRLNNRDNVVLWRHRHHNFVEVINDVSNSGFDILHSSTSLDRDQILVIAAIQKN